MSARPTMAELIQRVRLLANVEARSGTVGVSAYWSDEQVQAVLDRNRLDFTDDRLDMLREVNAGGTASWQTYIAHHTDLEPTSGGTAILYVRDSTGARVGTASYSADYPAGRFAFATNTAGTVYYVTGRSYDINGAAAEIWRAKAGQVADRFDFTADGASFKPSQLIAQYNHMADYYQARSTLQGVKTSTFVRDDVALYDDAFPGAYMGDKD